MTIELPRHIEESLIARVHGGAFPSLDAAMTEAARLLLERLDQEQCDHRAAPAVASDEALQRRLLEAGIVSEIKPPIQDFKPYQHRQAVPIHGEPLSETIIRERR